MLNKFSSYFNTKLPGPWKLEKSWPKLSPEVKQIWSLVIPYTWKIMSKVKKLKEMFPKAWNSWVNWAPKGSYKFSKVAESPWTPKDYNCCYACLDSESISDVYKIERGTIASFLFFRYYNVILDKRFISILITLNVVYGTLSLQPTVESRLGWNCSFAHSVHLGE